MVRAHGEKLSYLIPNSTPAQRARGQSFGEKFISSAKVGLNRGTIYGTPTIDFGATLNGTTDYIQYQLNGTEFDSPEISMFGEFWPYFDTDINQNVRLISAGSASDYTILKRANSGSNELRIKLGNSLLIDIAEAVYSPYWVTSGRNQIFVVGDSATPLTLVYLNTHLIGSSSVPWVPTAVTALSIGADIGGGSYFSGKWTEFKVFKSLLIEQEISDFWNNTTYNYRNRAVLDLPMLNAQHQEGIQTLDVSGNNNHAVFGGGAADPTKLSKRGYSFIGDYMTLTDNLSSQSSLCICGMIKLLNLPGIRYIWTIREDDADIGVALSVSSSGALQWLHNSGGSFANSGEAIDASRPHSFVACIDSSDNAKIAIDGGDYSAPDSLTIANRDGEFFLTRNSSAAQCYYYQFLVFPFALTPLQVADLHGKMMRSIQRV